MTDVNPNHQLLEVERMTFIDRDGTPLQHLGQVSTSTEDMKSRTGLMVEVALVGTHIYRAL
jgi:hypothetical protein